MNWLQRFYHAFKSAGVQAPTSFISAQLRNAYGMILSNLFDRMGNNNYDELEKRFASWVYLFSTINAQSVASVPLRVKRGKGDPDDEIVTDHPLCELLARVNPFDNQHTLIEKLQLSEEITGNWWLYLPETPGGIPSELWVLRPALMRPMRDPVELVTGWWYGFAPYEIPLDYDEVIHCAAPNLSDPILGMGWLEAALRTVNNDAIKEIYHGALFANNARPDIALVIPELANVSLEEQERIRDLWNDTYRGPNKAGGVAVLSGGLTVQDIGITPKAAGLMESMGWDRDKLAAMARVPKALYCTEDVNLANSNNAITIYMRFAITPRCRRMQEKLNERLVPMFGEPDLYVEFDECIPVDNDFALKKVVALWGGPRPAISLNEARGEFGYPPVAGGDDIPEPIAPAAPGDNGDNPPPAKRLHSHKSGTNGEVHDAGEPYGNEKLRRMLVGFFGRQQSAVVHAIQAAPPVPKSRLALAGRIAALEKDEGRWTFDQAAWNAVLAGDAEPILAPIFARTAGKVAAELGGTFDVTNQHAVAAVRRTVERFARSVNRTTATQIETAVREAIEGGSTMPDLTARIGEIFGDAKTSRAEAIARTEAARAMTAGTDEGYSAAGVEEKEWLASADACEFCQELNGQRIAVGSPFLKEGQNVTVQDRTFHCDFGDVDGPPLHPNDRCVVIPVLPEKASPELTKAINAMRQRLTEKAGVFVLTGAIRNGN